MNADVQRTYRGSAPGGAREISLETGRIGKQADGTVLIRQGDTVVLVSAVAATSPREGTDFLPLTVDYRERFSAAGRFPGGYRKREGRNSDREILSSRLIDRTIRPLFPGGFHSEIQVLATVLSYEPGTDPDVLAITGAAAALHVSNIPFQGPVAGIRVVKTAEGEWIAFPGEAESAAPLCDLVVSVGPEGLVMIEGEAHEVSEADLVEAIRLAGETAAPLHELCEKARSEAGREKRPFAPPERDAEFASAVRRVAEKLMEDALRIHGKKERAAAVDSAREAALAILREAAPPEAGADLPERYREDPALLARDADSELHRLESEILRRNIVEKGLRADGRGPADIRPICCEAGILPRVHGSALFTRGETQALVVMTLGTGRDEQEVETLAGTDRERFQLYYSFPPYSVGEVRPLRGPGRREIGHGNLARRALQAVLPTPEAFPYTIKVESEITESNGSSSMASVCGGCLALMDGGIPIHRPVAGIAMGLIQENGQAVVLSDILGLEDHLGDMDFKVAGTETGVTAVQLDNKVGSLSFELLERALAQARQGRLHILGEMSKALARPRPDLAPLAPRIAIMKIRPHRIRDLIGPGGRTIQDLQADTGTKVDVSDDGTVRIYASDAGALPHARRRIHDLTGEPEVGKIYRGTVTGVKEFGCFVRLFQGIEGLVHASELAEGFIRDVSQVAVEGEPMVVMVLGVDQGRIQLSRKAAMGAREEDIENA
jgi:polyribonucleotide nucleotidyltransferase